MSGRPWWATEPHGTSAAYRRHRRNGTPACERCLEAERLRSREWNEVSGYDDERARRYYAARAAGLSSSQAKAVRSDTGWLRFTESAGIAS